MAGVRGNKFRTTWDLPIVNPTQAVRVFLCRRTLLSFLSNPSRFFFFAHTPITIFQLSFPFMFDTHLFCLCRIISSSAFLLLDEFQADVCWFSISNVLWYENDGFQPELEFYLAPSTHPHPNLGPKLKNSSKYLNCVRFFSLGLSHVQVLEGTIFISTKHFSENKFDHFSFFSSNWTKHFGLNMREPSSLWPFWKLKNVKTY